MKKNLLLLLPLLGMLASCEFTGEFIISFNPGSSSATSHSLPPAASYSQEGNVARADFRHSVHMSDIAVYSGLDYVLPTGEVNLLVLPIEFSDYPFSSSFRGDLNRVLNGAGEEDTHYWESLSSYYAKSSYGQVNLNFTIAENYATGLTAQQAYRTRRRASGADFVREAVSVYKQNHGLDSTKAFDRDENGLIDGVIAVYSCPTNDDARMNFDEKNYFWAYTFWTLDDASPASPNPNVYFWLSCETLYRHDLTSLFADERPVDCHTLAHETGHMFGLDDYYPYNGGNFDPIGGLAMMSFNILDHDIYSKLALGWADPYIVTGPAEITINPSVVNGDCILIPTGKFNGTVFDEYMLIEFYVPEGLNYLDSHNRYPDRTLGFSVPGVKIYHVDSRLMRYTIDHSGAFTSSSYVENPVAEIEAYTGQYGIVVGATNCQKAVYPADASFSLIHLMEAGGQNTFVNGKYATNATLFQQGQSFSMASFGNAFFPKKNKMNNGEAFPYVITVKAIDGSTSATIEITEA